MRTLWAVWHPRLSLTVIIGAVIAAAAGCGLTTPPGPGSGTRRATGADGPAQAMPARTDVPSRPRHRR